MMMVTLKYFDMVNDVCSILHPYRKFGAGIQEIFVIQAFHPLQMYT